MTTPGVGEVFSGWSASVACSVDSSLYWVTRGAYDGIMKVARSAAARPCDNPSGEPLSEKRLAAIMIAVSAHEVSDSSGLCKSTFDKIYVSDSADLNVHIVEGWDDSDGGVVPRECRWSDTTEVACFLFDMDRREGYTPLKGTHPRSASSAVLAVHPFISFTDAGSRFAVWPKLWPASDRTFRWPTTVVQPGSEVPRCSGHRGW